MSSSFSTLPRPTTDREWQDFLISLRDTEGGLYTKAEVDALLAALDAKNLDDDAPEDGIAYGRLGGDWKSVADVPRWDDLRFPSQAINPAGSVAPATLDTSDGTLLFSKAVDNTVAVTAQMPHAWKEGTIIKPHVHWSKTTSASGTVAWKCEYKIADVGDVFGAFTTLATVDSVVPGTPDNDTANEHLISSFGEMDMTGYGLSTIIVFKITRDVSEDTYGASAKLYEFDIHYQLDSVGSRQEFTK